ncbi:MAG: protein phosphatase 2C domain-containing protein [Prevotellaceae bacterium]|jgi:serine/threonine protein phosphatase PrpC|nr:protein phosphatase 2C domain-containing protein [Prevotellaceae bacterium]
MNKIKIRLAARCEAAGRTSNEDNFQLSDNLTDGREWKFVTDKEVTLENKGALMVVCDGMGGMNAGEVASALAIETVKEWFSPDVLTDDVVSDSEKIKKHITKAIIAADTRIKKESRADKEKEGMGSTIVLAWIVKESVFIGWCGDSRAYRCNPNGRLEQLSHDHSYVQELVDAGKLDKDLAFDHPNNNIITRSLGDPNRTAKPDVKEYALYNNDIILLCSDGLCGVLRDEEIEEVIKNNSSSMETCRDALWEAARNAGWHDNVTIELCQILSGCNTKALPPHSAENSNFVKPVKKSKKRIAVITALIVVLLSLLGGGFAYVNHNKSKIKDSVSAILNKYTIVSNDTVLFKNECDSLESIDSKTNSFFYVLNNYKSITASVDSIDNTLRSAENSWRKSLEQHVADSAVKKEIETCPIKRLFIISDSVKNSSYRQIAETTAGKDKDKDKGQARENSITPAQPETGSVQEKIYTDDITVSDTKYSVYYMSGDSTKYYIDYKTREHDTFNKIKDIMKNHITVTPPVQDTLNAVIKAIKDANPEAIGTGIYYDQGDLLPKVKINTVIRIPVKKTRSGLTLANNKEQRL